MTGKTVLGTLAAITLTLLVPQRLVGQLYYSTIVGTVRDASGAVAPNVKVTAIEVSTNVKTFGVTNSNGDYRIENLRPGSYKVNFVAQGFDVKVLSGITLFVGQTSRVDATLDVGHTTEQVTVTGAAPLMQTDSAEVQTVVKGNEIEGVPLATRNFMSLSYLSTGAVATSGYRGEPTVFTNGLTEYSVQVSVDGGGITDNLVATPVERINIDSIEEFKIETSNYTADVGMRAGAQISVATKHGTNSFHGDLFEFVQNDKFNAANFFATTLAKAPVRYNDFGGTVGGPIVKNKLFFFGSYEGIRNIASSTFLTQVPTMNERNGDFTPHTGAHNAPIFNPYNVNPATGLRQPFSASNPYIIPQAMLNPISVKYLALWPLPDLSGTPNFTYNGAGFTNFNREAVRLDYNKSDKDTLYGRLGYQTNPYYKPGATPSPGMGTQGDLLHGYDVVVAWTHLLSPTKMNQARVSYAFQNWAHLWQAGFVGQNVNQSFGFSNSSAVQPQFYGCPDVKLSGVSTTGACTSHSIQSQPNKNIYISDDFTIAKGAHTIKAGVFLTRYSLNFGYSNPGDVVQSFTGAYTAQFGDVSGSTGQPFADFLLGYLPAESVNQTGTIAQNRRNLYQMYLMDTWRVNSKLTLQLGLRYDLNRPEVQADGRAPAYFDGLQSRTGQVQVYPANAKGPLTALLQANNGNLGFPYTFASSDYLYQPDNRNFGPRIGFAYRPFGNSRHVIRGGFGTYYEVVNESTAENDNGARPFTLAASTPALTVPAQQSTPAYAFGQVPVLTDAWYNPGELYNPQYQGSPQQPDSRVDEWNVTYQVELGQGFALAAGYLGNRNLHGQDNYNWNRTYPVGYTFNYADGTTFTITNSTPLLQRTKYPQIGNGYYTWPLTYGHYNSFQLTVEKRMSHGIQFRAGYTRSSSFGYEGETGQQSTINQDEWAPRFDSRRANDVPNIFYASYIWQLPGFGLHGWRGMLLGGWQNAGIVSKTSGRTRRTTGRFPPMGWRHERLCASRYDVQP